MLFTILHIYFTIQYFSVSDKILTFEFIIKNHYEHLKKRFGFYT